MRLKEDDCWGQLKRGTMKRLAKVKLNDYQGRILRTVMYFTISWNKISDPISVKQFVEFTGIHRRNLDVPIKGLIEKGVIWEKDFVYGLCKEYLEFGDVCEHIQNNNVYVATDKEACNHIEKGMCTHALLRSSPEIIPKKVLSNHEEEEKRKKNESGAHNILAMLKGIENKTNMNQ